MKDTTAKALAKLIVRRSNEQIEFLRTFEDSKSDDFAEVRRLLANTLGTAYLDILQPIFKKYPEIKPSNYP